MNAYIQSLNAVTTSSLWSIPHRDDIVFSLLALGMLCLALGLAAVAESEPVRLRLTIED